MKIFITGIAGFIGYHLAIKLVQEGHVVFGIDNFNYDYDPELKGMRRRNLVQEGIDTIDGDIRHYSLRSILTLNKPDMVIHLAAHAGVRRSLEEPLAYIDNNIVGTQKLIDVCEDLGIENVIYASTSCIMSDCELPWNEDHLAKNHMSPYAYTKATNEQQFNLSKIKNAVGLRFFTVYGPWGRPDMALFGFADKILKGEPIILYNDGAMWRDFTYIDDIVQGINLVVNNMTERDIYCIGYGESVLLMNFVNEIEKHIGPAKYEFRDKHPADALKTWSDTSKIKKLGYSPTTPIEVGIDSFMRWHKKYRGW